MVKNPTTIAGDIRGRVSTVRCRGGWVGSRVIFCSAISSSIRVMKAFCPGMTLAASPGMRRSTGTASTTCAGHRRGALGTWDLLVLRCSPVRSQLPPVSPSSTLFLPKFRPAPLSWPWAQKDKPKMYISWVLVPCSEGVLPPPSALTPAGPLPSGLSAISHFQTFSLQMPIPEALSCAGPLHKCSSGGKDSLEK